MKSTMAFGAAVVLALLAASSAPQTGRVAAADGPEAFSGEKTSWHGFARYDFLLDDRTLAVEKIKAGPEEKNGIRGEVKGKRRCIVVAPKKRAPGKPWSWRGCYWDHQPQAEVELLKRGFHVAFIAGDPGKQWDAWYAFLTGKCGLSRRPNFIGMSRGGFNAFTWATANPDKVSCIYADNPALSPASLSKLGELARHDVPLLHVCGSLDPLLGKHTLAVEGIYRHLGGRVSVMIKDGAGHHPHSLREPKVIADFIEKNSSPRESTVPGFVGKAHTRTAYYSSASSYRDFPSEKTHATCRGPLFTPCYPRYEFRLAGASGAVTVICPEKAAPGKPWVFRADFVGRDAAVDQALLAKGFHIVTGPVPYNADGPSTKEWDATYKHFVSHGFSKKAVMAGAGGAAGEAFAWAARGPERVSCIYCENPILRSSTARKQPLDNLAPLAKAGVPLFHACGALDPWLKSQTRVAEERYKKLGGEITVVVKEGEGHYPLPPRDVQAAVDFILKAANPDKKPVKDPQSAIEPRSKPGEGQKFLEKFVGDWEVVKTFHPAKGRPAVRKGTCRQEMVHGARFLRSSFTFGEGASMTTGEGLIGFEAETGAFTSVWSDSRSTRMSFRKSKGKFDGKRIVLHGAALGEAKPARESTTVTELLDGGKKIVHRQYAGREMGRLVMELVLTRKAK
jgi:pimeloyl-ACP methyl ester carboxylesterase